MASLHGGTADYIIYVISAFRRGEEEFNGVGLIKTDIHFVPGWVCSTVSLIS